MIGLLFLPSVIGLITCFLAERLGTERPRGFRTVVTLGLSAVFFAAYAVVRTPSLSLMRDGNVIMVLVLLIGVAGGCLGLAAALWGSRWLGYGVAALAPTLIWF